MSTATKRRPTIVSAYAYAHERQRADKLFQACAERDKIIAAQRQQIRDLMQQVRNARASLARMKRRDSLSGASGGSSSAASDAHPHPPNSHPHQRCTSHDLTPSPLVTTE